MGNEKFRVCLSPASLRIKNVVVERESLNSVWISGKRHPKQSKVYCYLDTWEEAHQILSKYVLWLICKVEKDLKILNEFYMKAKNLK